MKWRSRLGQGYIQLKVDILTWTIAVRMFTLSDAMVFSMLLSTLEHTEQPSPCIAMAFKETKSTPFQAKRLPHVASKPGNEAANRGKRLEKPGSWWSPTSWLPTTTCMGLAAKGRTRLWNRLTTSFHCALFDLRPASDTSPSTMSASGFNILYALYTTNFFRFISASADWTFCKWLNHQQIDTAICEPSSWLDIGNHLIPAHRECITHGRDYFLLQLCLLLSLLKYENENLTTENLFNILTSKSIIGAPSSCI